MNDKGRLRLDAQAVKRYSVDLYGDVFENETGEYVLASDSAALLAQIASLREALDELLPVLGAIPHSALGDSSSPDGRAAIVAIVEKYEKARAALKQVTPSGREAL